MTPGRALLLLATVAASSACAHHPTPLGRVRVTTDADANQDTATRLDLVFIYDQTVVAGLPATAPDWFARRRALLDANRSVLDVVFLEVPPDRKIDPVLLPKRCADAIAVRAYAEYQAPEGQSPLDLTGLAGVELRLRARDLVLRILPHGERP